MTMAAVVFLRVQIPETEVMACPAALSLIKTAPLSFIERENEVRSRVVIFPRLPESIDVALRLLGVIIDFSAVGLMVNDRQVENPTKFWTALNCYRDSLDETDKNAYCARLAARVSNAGGCPSATCLSHCQFICMRCLDLNHGRGAPPLAQQLRRLAIQAEAEWCPNLKLTS